jgi:hypothetical protein
MDYLRPNAWAGYCISGNPAPFINQYSIRATRREVQQHLGGAHAEYDQTPAQGWKKAYRIGWRCVKVRIEPLGELPQ